VQVNGVDFHVEDRGAGPPIVLLHGFTGSARSWTPFALRLARAHRVAAIDLIGHGRSSAPEAAARYEFGCAVDDLAAIARRLGIDRAAWLGYSMGGRLALALAVQHPESVSALILESATPGIEADAARSARRRADCVLAARIESGGIERFVQHWESQPIWQTQRALPESVLSMQREVRLANRPAGLANSLRGMGQGAQPSLWNRLPELEIPVLLIAGELDRKFRDIAARMHHLIPASELAIVPNVGHTVHLEQPVAYVARVEKFLARTAHVTSRAGKETYTCP
jgi:2-succinyl-6-hydroxy-2,4-cyclohexadiene-1-carboxylate synthase